MKISTVLLGGITGVALATPITNDVVIEGRGVMSSKWVKRDTIDANTRVPVRIALKQQNLDKGMDLLMEVSDPSSAKYGQHYTADQVVDLFAPKDESITAVKDWLVQSGIPSDSITSPKSKGWIDFTTTVGQLESLLQTKYNIYSRSNGHGSHIAADTYSIPGKLSEHVDFVAPAKVFRSTEKSATSVQEDSATESLVPNPSKPKPLNPQMVQKLKSSLTSTQYCADYVTPQCIRAFYNIPEGKLAAKGNRMGIFEDDDEMYSQQDLTTFYALFAPQIPSTVGPQVDLIDYGKTKPNPQNAEGEAALDFDMAQPLLYPQSTVLFQSHDNFNPEKGINGFFNQFLDAIDGAYCVTKSHNETGDDPSVDGVTPNEACGTFQPTHVISFSYGWSESVYPAGYLERQCDEFMKLGLQGTSLVFSSGDGGVAGGHGDDCLGTKGDIFNPQVGAACPYVTTVGATVLPSGSAPGDEEEATTSFASGGGFSNVWTTPNYQQSAVDSFFNYHDPGFPTYATSQNKIPKSGNGVFNRAGRGYPDVAAVGDNGVVVFDGSAGLSGGTSMAAPIFASILTRINEERLAKGMAVIGFANPALYSNPKMFNDITIGDQSAGGYCLGKGFKAVPGWDPVTGLGTPNYPAMLKYFMSLG